MKKNRTPNPARPLIILSLVFSLCCGIVISDNRSIERRAEASPGKNSGPATGGNKVSPDLRRKSASTDPVRVILQLNDKPSGQLNALLNRNGVHVRASFKNLNAQVVELPESVVDELASFPEVVFVSPDRKTSAGSHLTAATGALAVRQQVSATGQAYTLDGTGIGIAVLDSGIKAEHHSFLAENGVSSRVVVSHDFTGEGRTDDPYGHGTHVASLAAGNNHIANIDITGVARNANLINLRVLNSSGIGSASATLGALDWVMPNKATYNIRVVNMSVGMPAIDSYMNDPLCRAVRRLVDAGVVVVVAAGNNGKDSSGNKLYGRIHSPANEPSAITVGATNTLGTDARLDDRVATFSSRGPTRSFWTDASGVKHYDNLVKPDL